VKIRTSLAALFAAVTAAAFMAAPASAAPSGTANGSGTAETTVAVDPASVDTIAYGAKSSAPEGAAEIGLLWERCLIQGSTGNQACFEDYGDWFHVYDGDSDGASAAAYWWTDYGRSGICYNSEGAGTWASCNYNMDEDGIVYWKTCYQNRSAGGDLYCTQTTVSKAINGDW